MHASILFKSVRNPLLFVSLACGFPLVCAGQSATAKREAGNKPSSMISRAQAAPVVAGLRKQLLVDDTVIETRTNLERVLGVVRKENGGKPVMVPDRPWED